MGPDAKSALPAFESALKDSDMDVRLAILAALESLGPDAKPIVIQPDGDITINYLDTKGLPLTPDHLASATALVARMVGLSQSGLFGSFQITQ